MSNANGPPADERLNAYMDDQLAPDERDAFEAALPNRPELRQQVDLQSQIDASLRRIVAPAAPTKDFASLLVDAAVPVVAQEPAYPLRSAWRWAAAVGVAAILAWMIAGRFVVLETPQTPVFSPEPLVVLYQQAVANGFEPYYECREDERFQATFLRRQGQALTLAPLPDGSAMLGLSYPGGLSRDTTAMLCRVDGEPVMVFVDAASRDRPDAAGEEDAGLHVFRQQRDGLVFYEITPFESRRMVDYLISPVGASRGP